MPPAPPPHPSAPSAWAGEPPPTLAQLDLGRAFAHYRRDFAPYLPADRSGRILDFGCGWGGFLAFLAREGYGEAEGVDVDARCVDFVRAQLGPVARHVTDSTAFLAEHPARYAAIVMRGVACYLPAAECARCFAAAHQALQPGGRLIIQEYNGGQFTGSYPRYNDHYISTVFTEHSLRGTLAAAGFRVLTVHGARPSGRGTKQRIWRAGQQLWRLALRTIYVLERGLDPQNPTILERDLIAVGERGA